MATVNNRIENSKAKLIINGRFDFSTHRDFREKYEAILGAPGVRELAVDLHEVNYIDSSALGMLLLLREKAAAKQIDMKLVNTQGSVRQVLEVANFGRLFNIA